MKEALRASTQMLVKTVKLIRKFKNKLECGPTSIVMAALPNIGGALCSMAQFG